MVFVQMKLSVHVADYNIFQSDILKRSQFSPREWYFEKCCVGSSVEEYK